MNCVLVVEDDVATRESLYDVLKHEGYQVVSAPDASVALKHLRFGARPDVILLDLNMTPIDGYAFRQAQLADEHLAEIPIVAFTAQNARYEDRLLAMRVVRKPVALDVLLNAIAGALKR